MRKEIILPIIVFALVFFTASALKIKAGTSHNVTDWLWGGGTGTSGDGTHTNVRWISMNNINTAGGVDYGVNIPDGDGDVTGYAWSGGDDSGPGIGYINFDSAGPYPTVSTGDDYPHDVRRVGNKLVGWARFEQIAAANAAGNSGGWTGWIRMSSDSNDNVNYGVDIAKMDGDSSTKTYAYSDELGWIDFGGARMLLPPEVELTANNSSILYRLYLDPGEALPQSIDLAWTITNSQPADYCVATCDGGNCDTWNDAPTDVDGDGTSHTEEKDGSGGTETVQVSGSTIYAIICYNSMGAGNTSTVTVNPGCEISSCDYGVDGTCNFDFYSTTDGSDPNCKKECSSNSECTTETSNWREVSP